MRKRLIELRKEKGYSQTEVAEIIGSKRSNYSAYETGRRNPTLETAERLAVLLGEKDIIKLFKNE